MWGFVKPHITYGLVAQQVGAPILHIGGQRFEASLVHLTTFIKDKYMQKKLIRGFSLNRFLGISAMKQKISRKTGIPLTKQGRKRKLQNMLWKLIVKK